VAPVPSLSPLLLLLLLALPIGQTAGWAGEPSSRARNGSLAPAANHGPLAFTTAAAAAAATAKGQPNLGAWQWAQQPDLKPGQATGYAVASGPSLSTLLLLLLLLPTGQTAGWAGEPGSGAKNSRRPLQRTMASPLQEPRGT
jgi:hypothetical protein